MVIHSKPKKPYPEPKYFPSFFERSAYRSYNWIENRMWPIRPIPFLTINVAAAGYKLRTLNFQEIQFRFFDDTHISILKTIGVSFGLTYASVVFIRFLLKHLFFGYKGYLFENPKKPSIRTKLWGIVRQVLLLKFSPPILSSTDQLLPNLPLPNLEQTVNGYVDSMRNILTIEEYDKLKKVSKEFLKNEGRSLQRYAWVLHKCTDNYVTRLWEKFIYNAGRYPLPINSSVGQCSTYGESDCIQAYQVARVIYIETLASLAVDRQAYMVVGDGLLSTRHYKNLYNGCRIPGPKYDHFEWHKPAKHVVVVHEGTWYKVDICDKNRRLYTIDELSKIITELMNRTNKEKTVLAKIAALTCDNRTTWFENREKFFQRNNKNKKLLDIIESAMGVFTIDKDLNWGVETPEQLSKYMKDMLAGDGTNRWFDKTGNYAVDTSGRGGATADHSPCDGAELDHLCENIMNLNRQILEVPSKEAQQSLCQMSNDDRKTLNLGEELCFELLEGMGTEIERCYEDHRKAIDDLHLRSIAFMDFGKGRIKKCGVSPDGFVQMAIQFASYQDQGKFLLTYEPGSVRFYANSRTETLRPVTDASCRFVKAMLDDNTKKDECAQLLRDACNVHVNNSKKIMNGLGFDRHIFVLCVIAKAFGYSSEFLDHYASQKWSLSTSNIPNMTNSIDEDSSDRNIMIGGAFGAVDKDGYGICYRFGGDRAILVHITSYHSSPNTDSDRLADRLQKAFHCLAQLFDMVS